MDTTWIVVADSSHARIFQRRGNGALEELQDLVNPLGRADARQLASDGNGQYFGPGSRSHTGQQVEEPVEHEVRLFARDLAQRLDLGAGQRYQRLCLVAAPRFLGMLRDSLSRQTRKLVAAEVAKNLGTMVPHELDTVLRELLPAAPPA